MRDEGTDLLDGYTTLLSGSRAWNGRAIVVVSTKCSGMSKRGALLRGGGNYGISAIATISREKRTILILHRNGLQRKVSMDIRVYGDTCGLNPCIPQSSEAPGCRRRETRLEKSCLPPVSCLFSRSRRCTHTHHPGPCPAPRALEQRYSVLARRRVLCRAYP